MPFWTVMRKIRAAAGDQAPLSQVTVVPAWLVVHLASVVEWAYLIFTLGYKRPTYFMKHVMEYSCLDYIFSTEKAKERLGYTPVQNFDEGIRKTVEWELGREKGEKE